MEQEMSDIKVFRMEDVGIFVLALRSYVSFKYPPQLYMDSEADIPGLWDTLNQILNETKTGMIALDWDDNIKAMTALALFFAFASDAQEAMPGPMLPPLLIRARKCYDQMNDSMGNPLCSLDGLMAERKKGTS